MAYGHPGCRIRVEPVECRARKERLRKTLQLLAVLCEQACDLSMGSVDHSSDLLVHETLGGL
jgi:hypothetical protein